MFSVSPNAENGHTTIWPDCTVNKGPTVANYPMDADPDGDGLELVFTTSDGLDIIVYLTTPAWNELHDAVVAQLARRNEAPV